MTPQLIRRLAATTAAVLLSTTLTSSLSGPASAQDAPPREAFAALEQTHGARLGVYAIDTGTGRTVAYRAGERFAYASTIKALAAGAVLDRLSDEGLDRRVFWDREDLVDYSPVTSQHVRSGLTVREVIEAAITVSDNTAGNVLFELAGGTRGLETDLRAIGDRVTSVDRTEPDLNTAVPGDRRDTTSPRALADSVRAYVLGTALDRADRAVLDGALRRTSTGDALIRSEVPSGWKVGDKTGSASYGTRNDVAVIRPPGRAPIVLAVLTTHDTADATTDDALVAAAAEVVIDRLR